MKIKKSTNLHMEKFHFLMNSILMMVVLVGRGGEWIQTREEKERG